jgi:hypothetical protein
VFHIIAAGGWTSGWVDIGVVGGWTGSRMDVGAAGIRSK